MYNIKFSHYFQAIIFKLRECCDELGQVQRLINNQLMEWKRMQKLEQIGTPFVDKESILDTIQTQ